MNTEQKFQHELVGKVASHLMDKTAVVFVERRIQHPRYNKIVMRRTKLHVHDENNESKPGDVVKIASVRPISKTKAWKLVEVLKRIE